MNRTFEAEGAADDALGYKIRKDGLLRILSVLDQQYDSFRAIKGSAEAPAAGEKSQETGQSRGRRGLPLRRLERSSGQKRGDTV
ncbi:MAG: hypothetical protein A3J79_07615 [Elusimicrobia bacterium RIFOXYB2_FULL_62_6]|nr:MAG: hypothetical protein A3J79_07615 [Elusimicrobia bacterium RIFOXYB2_FULL_62_6]